MQLFWLLAVMGVQAVLLAVPSAYLILKIGGGLCFGLLLKLLNMPKPIAMENDAKSKMTYKQAYRYGLITQLSNPKIAVVLASVLLLYCQKKFQIITTSHYRSFVL